MDFIVSYHLYNKIKSEEIKEKKDDKYKELKSMNEKTVIEKSRIRHITCSYCGQDPYLCQCKNNIQCKFKNFNPEKDIY
tara:strand:+ start:1873 stop:2109 length:237 start_codon:yes stop_codon:yes gene_type:complete